MSTSTLRRLLALSATAALISACSAGTSDDESTDASAAAGGTAGQSDADDAALAEQLGEIPVRSGPWEGEAAVADGVHPPTNSWIAPAVFNPEDRPVFTGTLSARLTADEVVVGLPQPQAADKVVMGPHPDHVPLGLEADSYELTELDGLKASVEYRDGDTPVGTVTMAEGWPYVQYTATSGQDVALPAGVTPTEGGVELTVGEIGRAHV